MKISSPPKVDRIKLNTSERQIKSNRVQKWWQAKSDSDLSAQVLSTAAFLKESQQYRYRQTALYAKLYGNQSLYNFIGANITKLDQATALPQDRPTFNLIQSASDTLISKISQNRPAPIFLTDNSDYKERNLAKQLNNFIQGEFHQIKAHETAAQVLRDALVAGDGCVKVFETQDKKVGIERVLVTELLIDPNEALYGKPRQLYQLKLVDREVLAEMFPKYAAKIDKAANAYPDNSADSSKTVADLVMVVEAWRLPSGPEAGDGKHIIACSEGMLYKEDWEKDKFPFVFLSYSQRLLGFWSQGLAEQLMGTQIEINSLLYQISKSIKLVGVPRVFTEASSKVTSTSFNSEIGTIIKYQGTKPIYEVAQCVPQELYAQLERTIRFGYQQCGVSALQASSEKPAGLDSGEALRTYDNISTDRFALLAKKYETFFIDLAYAIIDLATDIAERDGKYQTVFPNKNGVKEINLPKLSLLKNPFVIQCFSSSSLPKDPAGRLQKVTEMMQAGMITVKEGRRLLDYPDLDQVEKLANAAEERIYQILDEIVEDSKYTPPDSFMDLELANEIVVQYINLYTPAKLEEDKAQLLRNFFQQIQALKQTAMASGPQPQQNIPPQAMPEPLPQSPLVPNANTGAMPS